MLMLYFLKPMRGGKITDDMPESWSISSFDCEPIGNGEAPDENLVINFAKRMVDEDGNPIPLATLRQYDLRNGLAAALRKAWA